MNTVLYLDTYIFINIILNFLIITLSLFTNKIAVKFYKTTIASVASSILSLFIMFSEFPVTSAKFILILLVAIFLFRGSYKLKIKFIFTCYFYSYSLAGIILSIHNIAGIVSISDANYSYVPVAKMFLSAAIMLLLTLVIRKFSSRQLKNPGNYKAVTITYGNKTINMIGFCDTGNTLYDYKNKCPIFVATSDILGKIPNIEFTETIECRTVSGTGEVKVFKPDKIIVENTSIQAMIGVSGFKFNNDYDLLLTEDIFTVKHNSKNTETENVYV